MRKEPHHPWCPRSWPPALPVPPWSRYEGLFGQERLKWWTNHKL